MEETIVRDENLVKQAEEMMEKQEFGERPLLAERDRDGGNLAHKEVD